MAPRKRSKSLRKSVSNVNSILKLIDHASRQPRLSSVAVNDRLLAIRHLLDGTKVNLSDLQDTIDKKHSCKSVEYQILD